MEGKEKRGGNISSHYLRELTLKSRQKDQERKEESVMEGKKEGR